MGKKHGGVFIEEDQGSVHKYVLVRTEKSSSPHQVTVYHLDKGNTLRRLDGPKSPEWPKLFFNVSSCHCKLVEDDISAMLRNALGVERVYIGGHHDAMGGMGSTMSGADAGFTPGNGVMMHGGHHTDVGGMYNRMDSKMSGNAMFMDMA